MGLFFCGVNIDEAYTKATVNFVLSFDKGAKSGNVMRLQWPAYWSDMVQAS